MVLSIGTRDPAVEKKTTIEDKSDWSSEKWLILCIYLNVCDYVIHGLKLSKGQHYTATGNIGHKTLHL